MSSLLEYVIIAFLLLMAGSLIYFFARWRGFLADFSKHGFRAFREYHEYGFGADSSLQYIIDQVQRDTGIVFTWGARQMLIIPVVETLQSKGSVNWEEVYLSILAIAQAIVEDDLAKNRPGSAHTSTSVIRGFHRRFCNIPPFCTRNKD